MRATVTLQLRHKDSGELLDERFSRNAVMQAGARLIASLFSGQGTPISHMAVGVSSEPDPETFNTAGLTVSVDELSGATEATIPPENFSIRTDETKRVVIVRVRGTMPNDAALGRIREAGLISRISESEAILYKRVTFDPIDKGDDHELTLFWEVTFPYGDLQWF